ncbi:MAG: SRPBCC domain-containing protein [Myxococcales bacterium]|nr:SRPBCC domain-containing protein [Myxococcales bacterium]
MSPEICLTQPISAPRSRIWRACSSARGMTAWQADEASGELEAGSMLELRWPALGVELSLGVLEVVPERRIVLAKGATRVVLELDDGGVALTHSGVGDGDEREGVSSSWQLSLGLLMHYCESHPESSRSVRWLMRPARTNTDTAHVFFTDRDALASWLGRGDGVGAAGTRFSLDLGAGETMTGRVLSHAPGRDVALSWEQDDHSVVVLRTLPQPFEPGVRLVVLSYSRWGEKPAVEARLGLLEAAHHRLIRVLDGERSA